MEFRFEPSHPFFDGILVYTMAVIGINALWNLSKATEQLGEFQRIVNTTGKLPPLVVTLEMAHEAEGVGLVGNNVLKNGGGIAEAIQRSEAVPPIIFSDLPPTGALQIDTSYSIINVPPAILKHGAQVAVGAAYESVKDSIENTYRGRHDQWPRVVEYFRHLRNAAFHNNTFNIRTNAIDTSNPPNWRTSVMPDDESMNSREFVEDFLLAGDIPILLGDVAVQLRADGVIK